jgi:hypothetical protein
VLKNRIVAFAAAAVVALVPAASSLAQTRTTEPGEIIRIRVTLTDTRMVVKDLTVDRGQQVDFWVTNIGRRVHDFTFQGQGAAALSNLGLSTGAIKPRKTIVLQLYMDYRGKFDLVSKHDPNKPGMKKTFTVL